MEGLNGSRQTGQSTRTPRTSIEWMSRVNDVRRVVAVFAPLYPPAFRGGGPIRSIEALVSSAPRGVEPAVLTSDRDLGFDTPLSVVANTWLPLPVGDICYTTVKSPLRLWRALRGVRRRRPELLHFNSFMNPRMTILPLLLWRIGFWGSAQILLAPRGEFGDAALRRRSLKKRIYIAVFRMFGLHRKTIWHSTAPHETKDIRRLWGEGATIIERGNDTLLAKHPRPPQVIEGPVRAAFLGRLVAHKGLSVALEALGRVTDSVCFDIYGSREDETYAVQCEALAAALPEHISVRFRGPILPDDVVDVLSEHDVLFMPTAGENFGHVIAEALSASCFVMTTPHTPWTDWLADGGGLTLERSASAWVDAIQELASEGADQRLDRRRAAGEAYSAWLARPPEPHVWMLVLGQLAKPLRPRQK